MYSSGAKRRRIKPYARPTSFDMNVRFDVRHYQDVKYNRIRDPYFHAASNDECFRVMEGELLAKSNSGDSRYNDKELHVFSFANGLSAPVGAAKGLANNDFSESTSNNLAQQKALRKSILKDLQYMGVSVTEFSPSRDVYEQGFVATIAGLNTIFNNSSDTIYPGQTLCMDLPELRQNGQGNKYKRSLQQGIPREKLQFIVRPRQQMLLDYGDSDLVNKFIIGTAISYSRPGDTVDVILHRMNYTSASVQPAVKSLSSGSDLLGLSKLVDESEKDNVQKGLNDIVQALEDIGDDKVMTDYLNASGENDLLNVSNEISIRVEGELRVSFAQQNRAEVQNQSKLNDARFNAAMNSAMTNSGFDLNDADEKAVSDAVDGVLGGRILAAGGTSNKLSGVAKKLFSAIKVGTALSKMSEVARGLKAAIGSAAQMLGDHPLSWSDSNAINNLPKVLASDTTKREIPQMKGASATTPSISAAVGVKKKKSKK